MSKLIACRNCKAMMSRLARFCPACGSPHPLNIGHCRICKTMLPYSEYRRPPPQSSQVVVVVSGSGSTSFGSSGGGFRVTHIPCPKCGEPEPLRAKREFFLWRLLFVLPWIVAFLGVVLLTTTENMNRFMPQLLNSVHITARDVASRPYLFIAATAVITILVSAPLILRARKKMLLFRIRGTHT